MILILHRRPQKGIKIINPEHAEINVDEVETSAIFYNMILGFDKVFVFNHWAVLQAEMSVLTTSDEKASDNISFRVNSESQITDIISRLNAEGGNAQINTSKKSDGEINISFSDPSGNKITLSLFAMENI